MTQEHPITPPPEMVQQWVREFYGAIAIATQAARWGADQELEACCKWLKEQRWLALEALAIHLRAARRPKPPSLKELALKALDDISIASFEQDAANTIREALEQLDD